MRQVREALAGARRSPPDAETPLAELRLLVEDQRIVVAHEQLRFDARTGQAPLDFPELELERETRASPRPGGACVPSSRPATPPRCWFARAAEWDGDPERWEAAVDAYERVLAIDPVYAAAWNNLGLLQHRMGQLRARGGVLSRRARRRSRPAPRPPSNLGSLQEDLATSPPPSTGTGGRWRWTRIYADAHFNLAGVLGKVGRARGRGHLTGGRYLELDLGSPWSQIARSHLEQADDSAALDRARTPTRAIPWSARPRSRSASDEGPPRRRRRREHALAWKLAQSPWLTELIAAPGNPGIARHGAAASPSGDHDVEGLRDLALGERVDSPWWGRAAALAGSRGPLCASAVSPSSALAGGGTPREQQGLRQGPHGPLPHPHRALSACSASSRARARGAASSGCRWW